MSIYRKWLFLCVYMNAYLYCLYKCLFNSMWLNICFGTHHTNFSLKYLQCIFKIHVKATKWHIFHRKWIFEQRNYYSCLPTMIRIPNIWLSSFSSSLNIISYTVHVHTLAMCDMWLWHVTMTESLSGRKSIYRVPSDFW